MKVSTILRRAADKYLWDGHAQLWNDDWQEFSCNAVEDAATSPHDRNKANDFLRGLGVNKWSAQEFSGFKRRSERQGARFLWLHFAALVAEDEGI